MEVKGREGQEKTDAGSAELGLRLSDDQERFAARFQGCRPHLLKLCRRILGDPDSACDAVSDTYLRAFRGLTHFDGSNFPGWLSRIAQYVCIDRLRRESLGPDLNARIESASTDTEMRILTAIQIRSILAGLSKQQRHCLKLFYIEGFTAKEIAKRTGFTDKQVKSYLQNGRRNFLLAWQTMEGKGDE